MPALNIGTLLTRHARYRPEHPALVVGDQRLSFRELNAHVNKLCNALLGSGARKGQKFATILSNRLELMAAFPRNIAGKTLKRELRARYRRS